MKPLLAMLLDSNSPDWSRARAASALGELGMQEAVPALIEIAEEVLGEPDNPESIHRLIVKYQGKEPDNWMGYVCMRLNMLISVIAALAKLGHQELSFVILNLLNFYFEDDKISSDAESVRNEASVNLIYIFEPEILNALKAARQREPAGNDVISFSILRALFYLGLKESVDEFINCFEADYPAGYSDGETLGRISGIVGEHPPAERDNLKAWWRERCEDFKAGVCYRWGKPIDISVIVKNLFDGEYHTDMLLDELTVITGELFEPDYSIPEPNSIELDSKWYKSRFSKVQDWAGCNAENFTPGSLYKYGHIQELNSLSC